MKKFKLLIAVAFVSASLASCSNNASLSNDLNNTGDSIVRFVNGTFSAQIDNTDVNSVYNATKLALNNSKIYNITNSSIHEKSADISGTFATDKNYFNESGVDNFSVRIVQDQGNIINIFIKIGKLGDKQASVDLLSNIRTNLGL
ncbi:MULTISPECIES: DUF3568 family protein [unclassified Francisella]|uniref:DUF3568 family protein n=1 Tax=unclassified Francisella TaxID=2610885 RepID=UPI002E31CD48|nr:MULTISPECIES: DUF3568 family protein [unclassified Francisella]MED7819178.1 DUF3568 family protein [Francisella sp. 19S2-4]MED7830002.1 DUF3568 family protein [Francisella sp. 19S2-10]